MRPGARTRFRPNVKRKPAKVGAACSISSAIARATLTVETTLTVGVKGVQPGTRNRLRIAALIYSMTNAVVFGAGIITVMNVSALRVDAYFWIPVVVVVSLILAAPIAWLIAPRLQARYDRRHAK